MASGPQNIGKPAAKAEEKSAPTVLVVDLHDTSFKDAGKASTKTLGDIERGNVLTVVAPPKELKDEKSLNTFIMASVGAHVKKHGTIPELRFSGHGAPNVMVFGKDDLVLNTSVLINSLQSLQSDLGTKVATKITFSGCNTFTEMSPEWVDFYRKASKNLGAELIGTTDWSQKSQISGIESLDYISFKNGEVGRFTTESSPFRLIGENILTPLKVMFDKVILGYDPILDNWTACHTGKTQEEGAACQKNNEKLKVENAKLDEWLTAPARYVREIIKELNEPKDDKGQGR